MPDHPLPNKLSVAQLLDRSAVYFERAKTAKDVGIRASLERLGNRFAALAALRETGSDD
jgi:hypothetical protein